MKIRSFYLPSLLICVTTTLSLASLSYGETICAPKTCTSTRKFHFESGKSYEYNYNGQVTSSISGISNITSGVDITARIIVRLVGPCQLAMLLKDCHVHQSNSKSESAEMSKKLEHSWLFFSFHDGVVEKVCPSVEDPVWVTNIKKGILSALQISVKDLIQSRPIIERDVHGDCPTRYEITKGWNILEIKKVKQLDECNNHVKVVSAVRGVPYVGNPHLNHGRKDPFLNGTVQCYHSISNGLIHSVECTEVQVVKQFSDKGNGAKTVVTQKLSLISAKYSKMIIPNMKTTSSNLLFNHDYMTVVFNDDGDDGHLYKAKTAISQLCNQTENGVHLFWSLVSAVKQLPSKKLAQLKASMGEICTIRSRGWQFFRDALPMAATAPALNILTGLTLQGLYTESEIDGWPIALGLAANPTDEAITALIPLLEVDTLFTRLSLTISSMINTLCRRDNATECLSHPAASVFVRKMADFATRHCSPFVAQKNEDQIIVALKALANVGHVAENDLKGLIMTCADNSHNPYEVRVAAIQLFRRMSCKIQRNSLWQTFSRADEDSELRIASYLQLMACPTTDTIQTIRHVLRMNDSVQVGGFVMSHLSNLRESSDPCKLAIKELLSDEILVDKYPVDVRKYSRYIERSIYSETLDMGGLVEANVVYSTSSFIPRSIMLNVTTDIFGNSYNLFEINARIEGFDHLFESMFRPEDIPGSFKRGHVTVKKSPFQKLQAITQLARLQRKPSPSSRASWSMKLFGSELWYSSQDAKAINSAIYRWSELSLADLLEKLAEDQQVDTSRAFIIIDSTMTVPTSLGFPMILSVNSTLNLQMKINGRFDIRRLHQGNCDLKGIIRPSASLSMSSALTVDSYVGRSGVALDVNANMLMTADGSVQYKNGRRLSVLLNVPDDTVNIADIRSSVMILNGVHKVPLAGITQDRVDVARCLSPIKSLGMDLCVALAYANASGMEESAPYFPLTGPSRLAVYFNKTDPSLTVYRLEYALESIHDERISSWGIPRSFLLKFDTPRSVIDREWTVDYLFNGRNSSVQLKILTPYKKFEFFGSYNHDTTWQSLRVNIIVDGTETLDVSADVKILQSEGVTQYSPKLLVGTVPGSKVVQVEGNVRMQPGRQLTLEFTVENLTTKPIKLKGAIINNDTINSIIYDMMFHSPALHFKLEGYMSTSNSSLASETSVVYQVTGRKKETVDVTAKLRYLLPSGGSLTKLSVTADVTLSVLPSLNSIVTWEFARAKGHLENIFSLQRHGHDHEIFIQQLLTYEGNLEDHQVNGRFQLRLPSKGVNTSIVLNHKSTLVILRSKLEFRPKAPTLYSIEAEVQDTSGTQLALAGRLALTLANKRSQVSGLIREERPRHYRCRFAHDDPFNIQRIAIVEYWHMYSDTWANHSLRLDVPSWPLNSTLTLSAFEHGGLLQSETLASGFRYSTDINYLAPPRTPGVHRFLVVSKKPSVTYRGRVTIRNVRDKILEVDLHRKPGTSAVETAKKGTVNQSIFAFARLKYTKEIRELVADVKWDPENKFNFTIGQVNRPNLKSTYSNGDYMDGEASFQTEYTRGGSMDSGTFAYQVRGVADWAKASKRVLLAMALSSSDTGTEVLSSVLKGSLEAATPVSGLECLGMTVERTRSKWRWNNSASLWWKEKSHVHLTASGRSWSELHYDGKEAVIQLDTPFQGLESAFVNWSQSQTGAESKTVAFVSWSPQDIIKASALLTKPSSNHPIFSANVDLHTPFTVLQHASASAYGFFNSQEFEAKMAATCNCYQSLSLSTRLAGAMVQFGQNGRRVNATFEAFTKIHKEMTTSMTMFHEKDDFGRFDNKVRISWQDRRKAFFRVHGIRSNYSDVTADLTAILETPYQEILLNGSFIKLNYNLQANVALHKNVSDAEEFNDNYNDTTVTKNVSDDEEFNDNYNDTTVTKWWQDLRRSEVLLTSTIQSAGNFSINTAFKVMDTIEWWPETSLSVSNTWNGSRLMTKFNGQHDDNQVGLDVLWSTGEGSLDGLILLLIPLQNFRKASLSVTHLKSNMIYNTSAECDWGGHGDVYSANHIFVLRDRFNFNTSLDIVWPFEDRLRVDIVQNYQHGLVYNYVKANRNTQNVLSSEVKANISKRGAFRTVSASWNMSAPLWHDGTSEIVLDYKDDSKIISPSVTICMHYPGSYCAQVEANIQRGEDTGTAKVYILLETPTETWSNVSLWASYSAPGNQMDVQTGVKWSPKGELSMDAGIRLETITPFARIHLMTPFPGFNSFKLLGGFDAASTTKTISGFVEQDGWQASISGHGKFDHDAAGVQVRLKTPNEEIGDISINSRFRWTGRRHDSKYVTLEMTWSHELQVEFQASVTHPEPGRSVLNLVIVTPLDGLRRINSTMNTLVKEDSSRIMSQISWYPDHSVNAVLAVARNKSVPLNIHATLEPTNSSFRVLIARNDSYTSLNLAITNKDREIVTEAKAITTGRISEVSAHLRNTLIPGVPITEVSAKIHHASKNYEFNATFTSNQHSTIFTGTLHPGKTLSFEALRLPSRNRIGNIQVKFDNSNGLDLIIVSVPSSATLDVTTFRGFWVTKGEGISTGISVNMFGSEHKATLDLQKQLYQLVVTSPKLGSGSWKTSLSTQTLGQAEITSFRVTAPTGNMMVHEVSLYMSVSPNSLTCKAHLDAPFLGLPFLNWTSGAAKTARGVEGSATLITVTGDKYFASSEYIKYDVEGGGVVRIEANTPYDYADKMWLHVETIGREWDNTKINADIKLPVPGYEKTLVNAKTEHFKGTLLVSLHAQTPLPGYDNVDVLAKLSYEPDYSSLGPLLNISLPDSNIIISILAEMKAIKKGVQLHTSWQPTSRIGSSLKPVTGSVVLSCDSLTTSKQKSLGPCQGTISFSGGDWQGNVIASWESTRNMSVYTTAKTPFMECERLDAKIAHLLVLSMDSSSISDSLSFDCDGQHRLAVDATGMSKKGTAKANITLSSSWAPITKLSSIISRVPRANGQSVEARLSLRGKRFIEGLAELSRETSTEGFTKDLGVLMDINSTWYSFKGSLEMDRSPQSFATNASLGRGADAVSLQANLARSEVSGRSFAFEFSHKRHKGRLEGKLQREDKDSFNANSALLWGRGHSDTLKQVAACNVWRNSSQGGIKWLRPGHTLMLTLSKPKRKQNKEDIGRSETELELLWNKGQDADKRLVVNLSHWNRSDATGLDHIFVIEIIHPHLARSWALESSICTQRRGHILVMFNTSLKYSPNEINDARIMLQVNDLGQDESREWSVEGLAVHGPSDLNCSLEALAGIRYGQARANAKLSWHADEYVMRASIEKQQPKLFVEMYGPKFQSILIANVSRSIAGDIEAMAECKHNGMMLANLSGRVHAERRFAVANFTLAKDWTVKLLDRFSAAVGWKDDHTLVMQTLHTKDGQNSWPIHGTVHRNRSRLATARFYWQTNLHQKIMDSLVDNIRQVHSDGKHFIAQVSKRVLRKARDIWNKLTDSAWTSLEPVRADVTEQVDFIKRDWQLVLDKINDMELYNDFYIEYLLQALEEILQLAREYSNSCWENLVDAAMTAYGWALESIVQLSEKAVLDMIEWLIYKPAEMTKTALLTLMEVAMDNLVNLWELASSWVYSVPAWLEKIVGRISIMGKEIALELAQIPTPFSHLKAAAKNLIDFCKVIGDKILELVTDIKNKVTESDLYLSLAAGYNRIVEVLLLTIDYIHQLADKVKQFLLRQLSEPQKQLLDNIRQHLCEVWQYLISLCQSWPLTDMSNQDWSQVEQKVLWILDYYQLRPLNIWTSYGLYSRIMSLFSDTLEASEERFNSQNKIVVDYDEGAVEMDQHLSLPWASLRSLPKLQDVPELAPLFSIWRALSTSDKHMASPASPYLVDYYIKFNRLFDYTHWMPPFQAQALLIGWRHVVTFNGRTLELPDSRCTYLLTSDVVDGNFSVAVNVDSDEQRSLVVLVDGRQVHMLPSEQVLLDNRKVELPITFAQTIIKRQGANIIVHYSYGLEVSCCMQLSVCSVHISGWYFGKTVGLFGVYDNEPETEKPTPTARTTYQSWELHGNARCSEGRTTPFKNMRIGTQPREQICWDNLVNVTSIMVNCYKTVDPKPFYEMCLTEEDDTCIAEAAYMQMCRFKDVLIRLPRICASCRMPKGQVLREGETVQIEVKGPKDPKTADIVFIVEAKSCNRNFPKVFAEFVHLIDNTLRSNGVRNNSYAIVVFGGFGVHDLPHVHTWDSAIFGRARSAPSLSNFTIGHGNKDVFGALQFAIKLPFRPGAAKTFILIACSECITWEMQIGYPEVHRMLLEDGVTLHDVVYKDLSTKNPEILYGFDGTLAYTSKDSRKSKVIGDADLRRQAIVPKDICVPIALESNGTVFSGLRLLGSNKRVAKSSMDVFARRLAMTASQDMCQNCDCLPEDYVGIGQFNCQPCTFPRPAHIYGVEDSYLGGDYPSLYELETEYFGKNQNYTENLTSSRRWNI